MFNAVNQFRRLLSDDGHNDKNFDADELRLSTATANLKQAAETLLRSSQTLYDLVKSQHGSVVPQRERRSH